jgi:hypothetical protein
MAEKPSGSVNVTSRLCRRPLRITRRMLTSAGRVNWRIEVVAGSQTRRDTGIMGNGTDVSCFYAGVFRSCRDLMRRRPDHRNLRKRLGLRDRGGFHD